MDEIQKILINAGRKDLAQKYYKKVSQINSDGDDQMYMVENNLKVLQDSSNEISQILKDEEDVDEWVKDHITSAVENINQVLNFVKSGSKEASQKKADRPARGYIELIQMHPDWNGVEKGMATFQKIWEKWKKGPGTKNSDIAPAKQEIKETFEQWISNILK